MNEILSWITAAIASVVPGFGTPSVPVYYGYAEANFVYVAPVTPGILSRVNVAEGEEVTAGQILFDQTTDQYLAAVRASEAQVAIATANWANQLTGSRPEELEVIRANLAEAEAGLTLAQSNFARAKDLHSSGFASQAQLDQTKTAAASANAQVEKLRAQLSVAELPGRDEAVQAAKASIEAAKSSLQSARIALQDRHVVAPAAGRVDKVYFRQGEMANAGTPVVSLLLPGEMRINFYIPEPDRALFSVGDQFELTCDNCGGPYEVALTRMDAEPQFTPPIIYSSEERTRLVFRAEALMPEGANLQPGQPVTLVSLK